MPAHAKTSVDESNRGPAIERWEWLVGVVLLLGIALRVSQLPHAVIEHFDEGVYASNIWFDATDGYRYPMQRFYAPPLLPILIEWSMILFGNASAAAAKVPSVAAGIATIILFWWLSRRWFGPPAACATVCLIALSDVHRLFSLAALTDVLLLLLLAAALGCFSRANRTGSFVDFAVAGGITGLAWWTKYNGWLPLAIALPGMVAGAVVQNRAKDDGVSASRSTVTRIRFSTKMIGWFIAALVAFVVWGPYLLSLEQSGGYFPIAANHRRYVVGLSGFFPSLIRQWVNLRYVDSLGGSLGWGAAVFFAAMGTRIGRTATLEPRTKHNVDQVSVDQWCRIGAAVCLVFAAAQWLGASVLCLLVGGAMPIVEMSRLMSKDSRSTRNGRFILISWFFVMLTLTPLYTPYLRLVLPLLGAGWLASGRVVGATCQWLRHRVHAGEFEQRWLAPGKLTCGVVIVLSLVAAAFAPRTGRIFSSRDSSESWKNVVDKLREAPLAKSGPSDRNDAPRVFYMYGEPGLLFHLRAAGEPIVVPVENLELAPASRQQESLPTFLVTGLHAQRDPHFHEEMKKHAARFEFIQSFAYHPGTLVLLDQFDPRETDLASLAAEVRLYRILNNGEPQR